MAANAFITSQAAAAAATVAWVVVEWRVQGKPTILGAASGCIAGLVAITPAAGFVAPLPALIIGAVGGVICYVAVAVVKTKLGYDDSLDAFGIHASAVLGAPSQRGSGRRQTSILPVPTASSTAAVNY